MFPLEKINTFSNPYFLISTSLGTVKFAIRKPLSLYEIIKKWTENWLHNFLSLWVK